MREDEDSQSENSLERLLITATSDVRQRIGGEGGGGRGEGKERQLFLARGGETGGEKRWAPIFTTRAVSGARDVNCRMGVCEINSPQKD